MEGRGGVPPAKGLQWVPGRERSEGEGERETKRQRRGFATCERSPTGARLVSPWAARRPPTCGGSGGSGGSGAAATAIVRGRGGAAAGAGNGRAPAPRPRPHPHPRPRCQACRSASRSSRSPPSILPFPASHDRETHRHPPHPPRPQRPPRPPPRLGRAAQAPLAGPLGYHSIDLDPIPPPHRAAP